MAVSDGTFDRVGGDPAQAGAPLSLLPSLLIHGAVVLVIWTGLFEQDDIQPPVTFISLAPVALPAPDLEPEFEPLPMPKTGMVLPQPEPPIAAPAPLLDFTLPELPEAESFPFHPNATRASEPEEAIAIEQKKIAEEPKAQEKPKTTEKPKETKQEKPKEAKKKEKKKKEKAETQPPAPPPAKLSTADTAASGLPPRSAYAPAKPAPPAPANPSPNATLASVSDAPIRVTNPALAGKCPFKYPERARKRNQTGTVVLRFTIGTDGKAFDIALAESSGHRILDEYAQALIATCKYVPQKRGDRAVQAFATQAVPFTLK